MLNPKLDKKALKRARKHLGIKDPVKVKFRYLPARIRIDLTQEGKLGQFRSLDVFGRHTRYKHHHLIELNHIISDFERLNRTIWHELGHAVHSEIRGMDDWYLDTEGITTSSYSDYKNSGIEIWAELIADMALFDIIQ